MVNRLEAKNSRILVEIAEIIAEGYLRIFGKRGGLGRSRDRDQRLSACPPTNYLDTAAPRSDRYSVNADASHSTERG